MIQNIHEQSGRVLARNYYVFTFIIGRRRELKKTPIVCFMIVLLGNPQRFRCNFLFFRMPFIPWACFYGCIPYLNSIQLCPHKSRINLSLFSSNEFSCWQAQNLPLFVGLHVINTLFSQVVIGVLGCYINLLCFLIWLLQILSCLGYLEFRLNLAPFPFLGLITLSF